jgi:hypothetical protein
MKYIRLFENSNDVNLNKDLEIIKSMLKSMEKMVEKVFKENGFEDVEFLYGGPYHQNWNGEYIFDETSIEEMGVYLKNESPSLYHAVIGWGIWAKLPGMSDENSNLYSMVNNSIKYSTEEYIEALKWELEYMEKGNKVSKILKRKGFHVDDIETNQKKLWMVANYPLSRYFDKRDKLFKSINGI